MANRNLTLRVDDEWKFRLERLLRDLGRNPVRHRSQLIRELISREFQYWSFSPYISYNSRHRILVSGNGTMTYWLQQHLYLVEPREKLPCGVFLKPEKKLVFERSRDRKDLVAFIQNHWLICYFSALFVRGSEKELIVDGVDHDGITAKFVDLPINKSQDTNVVREWVVAIRDYVQWEDEGEDGTADDRTDIFIDVPTLELDVQVLVDLDLYGGTRDKKGALDYEIRNRELARFRETQLKAEKNKITWVHGRSDEGRRGVEHTSTLEHVRDSMKQLEERIAELTPKNLVTRDGTPIINREESRSLLKKIRVPEKFLFGRLTWPMPYPNLVVCPSWNKPTSIA